MSQADYRQQLDDFVRYFCCDRRTAVYGPYEPAEGAGSEPEELIPGRLYRYRLVDGEHRPVDAQIYAGITGLGGLLWEQEVRVLLRVGMAGQPGLPRILAGGFLDGQQVDAALGSQELRGVAVVITRGTGITLADAAAIGYMNSNPRLSLRQFVLLAEGLATLHDIGVCHRNLWPGTVGASDADPPEMWLARFEMSALMANLFQSSVVDNQGEGKALRGLYLAQPARSLAYCPAERLAFLFPQGGPSALLEDEKADVYSLGALVWEWFHGPMPEELLPSVEDPPETVHSRLRELNTRLVRRLRTDTTLPFELTDLLARMLSWDNPRERPTSAEVVDELGRSYERIVATWDERGSDLPYLVAYMPEESKRTIYQWDWLEHSPETDTGRKELAALIQDDLRSARLLHSPHGAQQFVEGTERDRQPRNEAQYLLVGKRALWFCAYYRPRTGFGGLGEEQHTVLLIKYVVRRDQRWVRSRLAPLLANPIRRELPELEAVASDMDRGRFEAVSRDRPSWAPLTEAVRSARSAPDHERAYEEALDWLLEFQGAELLARTYACEHSAGERQRTLTVRLDEERDRSWLNESALLTKYADSGLRPSLGDFFGSLDNSDGMPPAVEVVPDDRGRPARSDRAARAVVRERSGPDRVVLELMADSPDVPATGWIRPLDDQGTRIALHRQFDGRWDLMRNPVLLEQLHAPMSLKLLPYRWQRAGERLSGNDGREAVRAILTHEPFFAVQGPPGTGKTTVTAEAVARYLQVYPGNRVLVSAQSNFALDNLAERILRRVDAIDENGSPTHRWDGVALRVASRNATVDETLKPWEESRLAEQRAHWIRQNLPRRIGRVGGRAAAVLEQWRRTLEEGAGESVLPELGDRLRRAANLVFATCAMSTAENVTPVGVRSTMDWVVVEEAAKAWPTELAVPLCRGRRWTLIGDHKQLPAHRRNDIIRFLDGCIADPDEEIRRLGANREAYVRAFDLFRSLFEPAADEPKVPRPAGVELPLLTLGTQYRMRDEISQVVSRVFYPRPGGSVQPDGLAQGLLTTGGDVPPVALEGPAALAGRSLVWLDTHDEPDCEDAPIWSNEGEARVVQELVESLRPGPVPLGGGTGTTLAVLSPYRQQNRLLDQRGLGRFLSTVHAFQGREADIVVVSLVRDRRPPGTDDRPWLGLGHLGSPDLINVLFSRARQLLVLVGDFAHFSSFGASPAAPGTSRAIPAPPRPAPPPRPGPRPAAAERTRSDPGAGGGFWRQVCTAVELYGSRVPVADLAGRGAAGLSWPEQR